MVASRVARFTSCREMGGAGKSPRVRASVDVGGRLKPRAAIYPILTAFPHNGTCSARKNYSLLDQ